MPSLCAPPTNAPHLNPPLHRAQGHKLNVVTAIGVLVWQFGSFAVIPQESVAQVTDDPAKCWHYGPILSRSSVAQKVGPNCALDISALAADVLESCVADPCTGYAQDDAASCPTGCTVAGTAGSDETCTATVGDCATGYVAGDADTPSTTCPTGCVFTQAVTRPDSTCAPSYAAGETGDDFTTCAGTGPGVCTWVPGTDCDAYFKQAAPNPVEYDAMEIHILEQACPAGCYFTPHIRHDERTTFWRVGLVFVFVTVPGVVSGLFEDPIRFGDPNASQIKVLTIYYMFACFMASALCMWYIWYQQGMDGYCKGLGHDTLTEAQRKHYGDEHRCAVYTGAMGSINMLLTLMLLVTYLIGLTGSCMVGCGGDGAYGYEEEGDEESK